MLKKSDVEKQVDRIFRHVRQNSYGTRAKYHKSASNFAKWLNENFKTQNLRNLHDKHLVAYIEYRQDAGIAPKTIKTDLSAIRFMHSQISNPRYELSENKELGQKYGLKLGKTPAVKGDRAWTEKEYQGFKDFCVENGRQDVADIATLCRTMGLRITEAVAIKRSQAEQALRTGIHKVMSEGKNGLKKNIQCNRLVPLSPEAREVFERRMQETPRGGKLFIENGENTHHVVDRYEHYLNYHRNKIETKEGIKQRTWTKYGVTHQNEITWHGLRYGYAQERLSQELKAGQRYRIASKKVSKELGHGRISVMSTYLGGK